MAIAKAECHCSVCGKDFEVRVHRRNRTEAFDFEEWAVSNITVCRECQYNQKKKEEHEHAVQCSDGLPDLKGTEKQVAWAFDIRGKFTNLDSFSEQGKKLFIEEFLMGKTYASWWIYHRSSENAEFLIKEISRGAYGKEEQKDLEEKIKLLKGDQTK